MKEDTIKAIVTECRKQGLNLPEQIAYVIATADWETAHTMLPVREAYWKSEDWREEHLRYYPYYGRGFVQLTWKYNYIKYSKILDIDMVADPDLALSFDVALFILVHGFKTGAFTGKKIADYINESEADFFNARRCINGIDQAQKIAQLAEDYLDRIEPAPAPPPEPELEPVPAPAPTSVAPGVDIAGLIVGFLKALFGRK